MRTKHTFRLPPDLMNKVADYAARKGVTQSLVLEAALASHLSPDGADRLEAALARRLDRMTPADGAHRTACRHLERGAGRFRALLADQHAPIAGRGSAAAQAKGRERYEGFIEALGRRLARGRKLADEIVRDVGGDEGERNSDGDTS